MPPQLLVPGRLSRAARERSQGFMKHRPDIGNLLAILFVIAGTLPIVWWLATRLLPRLRAEHAIQAVLVLLVLYAAWWFRKRMERK